MPLDWVTGFEGVGGWWKSRGCWSLWTEWQGWRVWAAGGRAVAVEASGLSDRVWGCERLFGGCERMVEEPWHWTDLWWSVWVDGVSGWWKSRGCWSLWTEWQGWRVWVEGVSGWWRSRVCWSLRTEWRGWRVWVEGVSGWWRSRCSGLTSGGRCGWRVWAVSGRAVALDWPLVVGVGGRCERLVEEPWLLKPLDWVTGLEGVGGGCERLVEEPGLLKPPDWVTGLEGVGGRCERLVEEPLLWTDLWWSVWVEGVSGEWKSRCSGLTSGGRCGWRVWAVSGRAVALDWPLVVVILIEPFCERWVEEPLLWTDLWWSSYLSNLSGKLSFFSFSGDSSRSFSKNSYLSPDCKISLKLWKHNNSIV